MFYFCMLFLCVIATTSLKIFLLFRSSSVMLPVLPYLHNICYQYYLFCLCTILSSGLSSSLLLIQKIEFSFVRLVIGNLSTYTETSLTYYKMEKTCKSCMQSKPFDNFYQNGILYRSCCKDCERDKRRGHRAEYYQNVVKQRSSQHQKTKILPNTQGRT